MNRVPVVLVWPAWQRLLHWALAASVVAAIATHELGRPHEVIGYASLALALLRIGLGIAGPREARFASFVRGASATLAYARAVRAHAAPRHLNHNPLGAWMVLALLGVVTLAAVSGALFVTDRFWGLAWLANLHAGVSCARRSGAGTTAGTTIAIGTTPITITGPYAHP